MREMMNGNIAIAEAAVRAGCRFYAGYPITPTTEIMEYLSGRLPEVGGAFVQAESEIAGINMVNGAASCGVRAMTASSGPGISLKQEGITTLFDEKIPAVLINMVRYGNGIGTLLTSQSDYLRDTRGGGNGDYRVIILCPESVQEAVDQVGLAFDLAEKYRTVVEIMGEGALGQMNEPCVLPEMQEVKRYPWGFDGKYTTKLIGIFDRDSMKEAGEIREQFRVIKENEQRWESAHVEDAETVFVAFGLAGRSVKGVVQKMRGEGKKVGFIRPITVWPFPEKAFAEVNPDVKQFITVEANATGMLVDDVALTVKKTMERNVPVYCSAHVFGIPVEKNIRADYEKVVNEQMEAMY